MRPRNLRIEGFTCFADPLEIDFSDMDVFVIAGPTGSGKTTLIDAICYALYGKTPRVTRDTNNDLISPGRDTMRVQFEFEVGGQQYRVHRGVSMVRRQRRDGTESVTRAPSPVQFEQCIDGLWEPLSDRVQDLNGAIEQILGLDFDGFTRCVLLPQGKFQEFLSGDKKARRDILIELLQLAVFARVQQAANKRASDLGIVIGEQERRLREDYAGATLENLEAARAEFAGIQPRIDALTEQRDKLMDGRQVLETWVDRRQRQRDREQQAEAERSALESASRICDEGAEELQAKAEAIAAYEQELSGLVYDGKLHQDLRVALNRVRDLQSALEECTAAEEAAGDSSAVEAAERAHKDARAECDEAERQRVGAEGALDSARREDTAGTLRRGLKKGDPCPVCGEALKATPKEVHSHLDEAEKALKSARERERKAQEALTRSAQVLSREQQRSEHATKQAAELRARVERLSAEVAELLPDGMSGSPAALQAEIETLEATRKRQDELNAVLERTRQQVRALEAQIGEAKATVERGKGAIEALLKDAEAAKEEARERAEAFRVMARENNWESVLEVIEEQRDPRREVESLLRAANDELMHLSTARGQLEREIERIAESIETAKTLADVLEGKRQQMVTAKTLGQLLRVDKFQDYVLEESLVTLAEAASVHLETLHDRFKIEVEKGEFVIVDHWQADNRRPATTLSGGETFVASLALALALSEKLPEIQAAAATRLESLFLDEGFGTLDPEKLDTVISALEGLRAQDRMVGIITHVPELAQRISTRIDVIPSPAGSRIEVHGA